MAERGLMVKLVTVLAYDLTCEDSPDQDHEVDQLRTSSVESVSIVVHCEPVPASSFQRSWSVYCWLQNCVSRVCHYPGGCCWRPWVFFFFHCVSRLFLSPPLLLWWLFTYRRCRRPSRPSPIDHRWRSRGLGCASGGPGPRPRPGRHRTERS